MTGTFSLRRSLLGLSIIDGLRSFSIDEICRTRTGARNYAEHYALAAMFNQDDAVQAMTTDGEIISFNFNEVLGHLIFPLARSFRRKL